jgi:hypothetical protein
MLLLVLIWDLWVTRLMISVCDTPTSGTRSLSLHYPRRFFCSQYAPDQATAAVLENLPEIGSVEVA